MTISPINVTRYTSDETAKTCRAIARQRAEHLFLADVKTVIELCVGPSARILSDEYATFGITSIFNDIEEKWKSYSGILYRDTWRIGDCLEVDWVTADAVVFAPPLSRGCSGRREDALMIEEVTPSYYDFLMEWTRRNIRLFPLAVLVLPARSLATKEDRAQYHRLINHCSTLGTVEDIEMIDGCRKYVDVYIHAR